jgi:acetyl-CoA decarbonylase/synthase complex subunit delta
MPFKSVPQKFTSTIKEVIIGTGDSALTLGGEQVFPLYSFDGEIKNSPRVGIDIPDQGPDRSIPGIASFYAGAETVADAAELAC